MANTQTGAPHIVINTGKSVFFFKISKFALPGIMFIIERVSKYRKKERYKKLGIFHCTYLGVSGYNIPKNIVFFCLKIFFTLSNSVDPDEMQHYAAFHLGLHCLQKYSLIQIVKKPNMT